MEKIAKKLSGILIERQIIDNSMYDILYYGLLRMLEIGIALFTSIVICLSMGMIKEGLIFFAFFIPIRSYLGGVHLKKYWQCYLVSCLMLFTILMIVKFVVIDIKFIAIVTILGVIGIILVAIADYRKQKNKIYFLIVCTALALLMILMVLFYEKEDISMMLLLCCTALLVLGSKLIEQLVGAENCS